MKKLFAVAFTLFLLAACGKNDDDTSGSGNLNPDTALLKSFKLKDDFGDTTIGTYEYDGNKLTRITYDDGTYEVFTYTGLLLTKGEYFEDGEVLQKQAFTYDGSDRLIASTLYDYDPEFPIVNKSAYDYNSNGTITVHISEGITEESLQLQETGTIVMENGNITSYTAQYEGLDTPEVFTYEFDNKHNPLKNIVGYEVFNLAYLEGGANNIKKYTISPDMEEYTTTYKYNSAGFPVKSTEDEGDGDLVVIEYFYQ